MNLSDIEYTYRIVKLGNITLTAAELRYLLNLIEKPAIASPVMVVTTRPNCPYCAARLMGEIAHNQTRCPGCGEVVTIKHDDTNHRMVVEQ